MPRLYDAETADSAWLAVRNDFVNGNCNQQTSRLGPTLEISQTCVTLHDPLQRWITVRKPAISPAFAIVEVIWILSGRCDARVVNAFNSQLSQFAGNTLEYHGAYGYRLRKNFGFDQLKKAFLALRNNPDSRQVVMQVWDPKRDFPTDLGEPIAADIPCNLLSMLKVREGMLEWTQVMRSNDAWRGLPYNLVQFTTLHELMAGWLGLLPGSFSVFSDSLHVYENDLPLMKHIHQQSRHLNTDSLALPIDECEVVVSKMEAALEKMLEGQHPEHVLDTLQPVIPQAYLNLFTVVAAEWARRQGLVASASDIMKNSCRNVLLQILWDRWAERFASPLSST